MTLLLLMPTTLAHRNCSPRNFSYWKLAGPCRYLKAKAHFGEGLRLPLAVILNEWCPRPRKGGNPSRDGLPLPICLRALTRSGRSGEPQDTLLVAGVSTRKVRVGYAPLLDLTERGMRSARAASVLQAEPHVPARRSLRSADVDADALSRRMKCERL